MVWQNISNFYISALYSLANAWNSKIKVVVSARMEPRAWGEQSNNLFPSNLWGPRRHAGWLANSGQNWKRVRNLEKISRKGQWIENLSRYWGPLCQKIPENIQEKKWLKNPPSFTSPWNWRGNKWGEMSEKEIIIITFIIFIIIIPVWIDIVAVCPDVFYCALLALQQEAPWALFVYLEGIFFFFISTPCSSRCISNF